MVMYGDSPMLRSETLLAILNRHRQSGAYLTILTCIAADPTGYGRILRDQNGSLLGVVEEKAATLVQRALSEVNSGVYVFDSQWLWSHLEKIELNAQGEYYLTDLIGMAINNVSVGSFTIEKSYSAPWSGRRMSQSETCAGSIVSCTIASKSVRRSFKSTSLRKATVNAASVFSASYFRL